MKVLLLLSVILASSQASPVCDICISTITQIEEVITDPSNEALVTETLIEACKLFFPNEPDQSNCINEVNIIFPDIIDMIVNDYAKPEDICNLLSACP